MIRIGICDDSPAFLHQTQFMIEHWAHCPRNITLELFEDGDGLLLKDGFFKCHRSYIINIHHIDSYTPSEVVMHSGCRIPISRSIQKQFEEAYFRIVFEKAGDEV